MLFMPKHSVDEFCVWAVVKCLCEDVTHLRSGFLTSLKYSQRPERLLSEREDRNVFTDMFWTLLQTIFKPIFNETWEITLWSFKAKQCVFILLEDPVQFCFISIKVLYNVTITRLFSVFFTRTATINRLVVNNKWITNYFDNRSKPEALKLLWQKTTF